MLRMNLRRNRCRWGAAVCFGASDPGAAAIRLDPIATDRCTRNFRGNPVERACCPIRLKIGPGSSVGSRRMSNEQQHPSRSVLSAMQPSIRLCDSGGAAGAGATALAASQAIGADAGAPRAESASWDMARLHSVYATIIPKNPGSAKASGRRFADVARRALRTATSQSTHRHHRAAITVPRRQPRLASARRARARFP
jgi:hypothetical protein